MGNTITHIPAHHVPSVKFNCVDDGMAPSNRGAYTNGEVITAHAKPSYQYQTTSKPLEINIQQSYKIPGAFGPEIDGCEEIYSNDEDYWLAEQPPSIPPHMNLVVVHMPPGADNKVNTEFEIPYNNNREMNDIIKVIPVPQHVMLNHLACAKDMNNNQNVNNNQVSEKEFLVMGLTHRYKQKFITTIYYRPKIKFTLPEEKTSSSDINHDNTNTNLHLDNPSPISSSQYHYLN